METVNIRIDDNQAKIFARAIYSDITAYIEFHQDEYQRFLLKQEKEMKGDTEDEGTH